MNYTIEQSDNVDELLANASTMIYGDSGIGKTTIARNWPNPVFLMMTGGGEHEPMPLVGRGIPFVRITRKEELDAVLLDLNTHGRLIFTTPGINSDEQAIFKKLRSEGKTDDEILSTFRAMNISIKVPKDFKCETIIIDQLTTMYNVFMKDILSAVKRTRDNPETPNQQDYGQIRRRVHDIFYEINRVPNLRKVYLCLAERDRDPETGMLDKGLPMLAGKLASEVVQFVDFVFYMHLQREQDKTTKGIREYRRIATQPFGKWQAKDSSGKLPPFIELPNPDFPLWDFMVQTIRK